MNQLLGYCLHSKTTTELIICTPFNASEVINQCNSLLKYLKQKKKNIAYPHEYEKNLMVDILAQEV